jgi:Uma2 family endonuclease
MTIAKELGIPQDTVQDVEENVILPPSNLYSDEPPLETELHLEEIILLLKCLKWLWRNRTDFYAAGNLTMKTLEDQTFLSY